MKLQDRIIQLDLLGKQWLKQINSPDFECILYQAKSKNGWFTNDNVKRSIENICTSYLEKTKLETFTKCYDQVFFEPDVPQKIGIIAAGNIPLVGFQDLLHVLLSGHVALFKSSSQDDVLFHHIHQIMEKISSELTERFLLVDKIKDADAYIATGSNNTSRYFEHYFGHKPNIIRSNRNSIAILSGKESKVELANLGNDIMEYFGLGCRNISKLLVPQDYEFSFFFEAIEYWSTISLHSKYKNNYDYMKSIFLINRTEHLDNGFLLLHPAENLASPISVVHYEHYSNKNQLADQVEKYRHQTQLIVSKPDIWEKRLDFGQSQQPALHEYADGVDVIQFLSELQTTNS